MNNVHAKKRKAGPGEVGRVLDEAARWCKIDVVCGDLNMARWNGDLEWHGGTLEHLASRDFMPIADYVGEMCFIAIARTLAEEHHRSF